MRNPRKLTIKQIERLQKILEAEQQTQIFSGIYTAEEFNLDVSDKSDDVDLANSSLESSTRLRFRNREVFYGRKIAEALQRINDGEYGICDECGANIGYKRLIARPTADQCIICKEDNEKVEMGSALGRISKSFDISKNRIAVS